MDVVTITESYVDSFIDLLSKIHVCDNKGHEMSFAEGVKATLEIIRTMDREKGKIIFIGNGGSAAIASHFAMDYWHAGGIKAIDFNSGPLLTCMSNDHGYENVFSIPIKKFAEPRDILVAISSSGKSKNILNAAVAARDRSCQIVTLSGFENDNRLKKMGDINFYVPVSHYGYVELAHKVILHCILDILKEQTRNRNQQG
jgi:D-sedoheptulose 7-phosphate isomerase